MSLEDINIDSLISYLEENLYICKHKTYGNNIPSNCNIYNFLKDNSIFKSLPVNLRNYSTDIINKFKTEEVLKIKDFLFEIKISNENLISLINYLVEKLFNSDSDYCFLHNRWIILYLIICVEEKSWILTKKYINNLLYIFTNELPPLINKIDIFKIFSKKLKLTLNELISLSYVDKLNIYNREIQNYHTFVRNYNIIFEENLELFHEIINKEEILKRLILLNNNNGQQLEILIKNNFIEINSDLVNNIINQFVKNFNFRFIQSHDGHVECWDKKSDMALLYEDYKRLIIYIINKSPNLITNEHVKIFSTDYCKYKDFICTLMKNRYILPKNFISDSFNSNTPKDYYFVKHPKIYVLEIINLGENLGILEISQNDLLNLIKNKIYIDQFLIDKYNLKITKEIVDICSIEGIICPYKITSDIYPDKNSLKQMIMKRIEIKKLKDFQKKYNIIPDMNCLEAACSYTRNMTVINWILSFDTPSNPIKINFTCLSNIIIGNGNNEMIKILEMYNENEKADKKIKKEETNKDLSKVLDAKLDIKLEKESALSNIELDEELKIINEITFTIDNKKNESEKEKKIENENNKLKDLLKPIVKIDAKPSRKKHQIKTEIKKLIECEEKETYLNFKKIFWKYILKNNLVKGDKIELNKDTINQIKNIWPEIKNESIIITFTEFDNLTEHIYNNFT